MDLLVGDGTATRLSYDVASGHLSLDRSNSGHLDVAPDFPSSSRAQVPMRDGHGWSPPPTATDSLRRVADSLARNEPGGECCDVVAQSGMGPGIGHLVSGDRHDLLERVSNERQESR